MRNNEYRSSPWSSSHGLIPALVIIGVGVLFLLSNLHVLYMDQWYRYWPVLLIAAGMAKMLDANFHRGRVMGGVLIAVGGLLLADNLNVIRLTWDDFWPLVLIGVGVLMLVNRLTGPRLWMRPTPTGFQDGVFNANAIFSGFKRKVTESDFRGANLTAIFGGGELNLRNAGMSGESAIIHVSAIFGGVEIKVPPTWIVVSQGTGIFGGFADETIPPRPDTPGVKKLYIKGEAVFGGVNVKN